MLRAIPLPYYGVLACVLVLVVIASGAIARNASTAVEPAAQEEAKREAVEAKAKAKAVPEEERLEDLEFELTPAAFDGIPVGVGVQRFSLAGDEKPEIPEEELASVEASIAAIAERADASVVFVDVKTGRGLAYEPDCTVYGASSFKALYSLYVCESLADAGVVSLGDYCPVGYAVDSTGGYVGGSYPVYDLIETAIVESNNNAYGALRDAFDFDGFDEWVVSLGATDAKRRADSWFPTYCARSSARLWAEMLAYVNGGTENALWLWDLTGQTMMSFIRDGLEGTGAVVHDKAGWCADADPAYNSVSDAGVVDLDGGTYIMSIMTGMPDSQENRALVGELARALLDCRGALGVGNSAED